MKKERRKEREEVIALMMSPNLEDYKLGAEIKKRLYIRFSYMQWKEIIEVKEGFTLHLERLYFKKGNPLSGFVHHIRELSND